MQPLRVALTFFRTNRRFVSPSGSPKVREGDATCTNVVRPLRGSQGLIQIFLQRRFGARALHLPLRGRWRARAPNRLCTCNCFIINCKLSFTKFPLCKTYNNTMCTTFTTKILSAFCEAVLFIKRCPFCTT